MIALRKLFVIIASVTTCLAIALPVLAIDNPDVGPEIHAVYAFQNAAQSGDMLFFVDETTDYVALPNENAFSAFSVSLIDEDTVTVIGTVPLTVFHTAGYGRNIAILYFNAASVTANTMVWGDNFVVSLAGNPALTWPGAVPTDTLTDPDDDFVWSGHTSQALVQQEIATLVITLAEELDSAWGTMGTASALIEYTNDGKKLSEIGMSYFNGILKDLDAIAPDAFKVTVTNPAIHKRTYGSGGATALAAQTLLTPFDLTGVATSLGLSVGWLNSIVVLALIVGIDWWFIKKQMSTKGIILIDIVIFIIAAIMGVLPLLIVLGGAAVSAFIIINVFFLSRSSA